MVQTNANYVRTFALTRKSDSTPIDLTGLVIQMDFKNRRGSSAALTASIANFKLSPGTDPTLGKLTLSLTYADVKGLAPGNYLFDVVIVRDANNQQWMFGGTLPLGPGSTLDQTASLPAWDSGGNANDISVVFNDALDDISVEVEGVAPIAPGKRIISTGDADLTIKFADNDAHIFLDATGGALRVEYDPGIASTVTRFQVTFFKADATNNKAFISATGAGDGSGDMFLLSEKKDSVVIGVESGDLWPIGRPQNYP